MSNFQVKTELLYRSCEDDYVYSIFIKKQLTILLLLCIIKAHSHTFLRMNILIFHSIMVFPSIIQEPGFRHEFHENEMKKGESVIYDPVLLAVLGAGAFYDVREHRIPNWWFFTGAAVNLLLLILKAESPLGAELFFQVFLCLVFRMTAVILGFFVLFLCRMIGAGDIKMAALICGYLGLKMGMAAVFSGFFLGAVWSLLKLLATRSFTKRISYFLAYIRRLIQTKELTYYYVPSRDGYDGVIPLGLCLFLGTLFIIH